MRKLSVFAAAMMVAVGVFAATNEVTSVNVVGFNKVAIPPNAWAMVTLNFESFGDSTIGDLVGDQLPSGSKAYIWDRAASGYALASVGRGGWAGDGATNVILRGDGFWLYNSDTVTNEVSLKGEVPAAINGGDSTTLAGYTAANGATVTTDGDIATFTSVPYEYYICDDWVTSVNNTNGWTYEIRFRIGSDNPDIYHIDLYLIKVN